MATKYLLERDFYGKHGTHYAPDPNGVYIPDYETPPSTAVKVSDSYQGVSKNVKLAKNVSPFGIQGASEDAPPPKKNTQKQAKEDAGLVGDDGAGDEPDPAKVASDDSTEPAAESEAELDGETQEDGDAEMAKLLAARNRVSSKPETPETPSKRGNKRGSK